MAELKCTNTPQIDKYNIPSSKSTIYYALSDTDYKLNYTKLHNNTL